jgi:putative NADPH-quinone reductase
MSPFKTSGLHQCSIFRERDSEKEGEPAMNILAVNGSPRGKSGNTEQLLQSFLNGANSAGATTEVVYLKEKKINHCLGCFTCWTKTPGVCVHRDAMPDMIDKLRQSDLTVYATPVYIYSVTGIMKDFLDRQAPLLDPHTIKYGDRYGHPLRPGQNKPRAVLISTCGLPDRAPFSGIVETFRLMHTTAPGMEFIAAILCTAGELLTRPAQREQIQWYLDACRSAGHEVVSHGKISPATQSVLDRALVDPETYTAKTNAFFDKILSSRAMITAPSKTPASVRERPDDPELR